MQPSSLQSLDRLPPPLSGNFTGQRTPSGRRRASASVLAMKRDRDRDREYGHKLVDDNMIVLRMRIQELKMKEAENSATMPGNCMRREKGWRKNYEADVCEAVGLLQVLLMDTRPGLAVGLAALLMFSVSTSLGVLVSYLLGIVM